MPRRNLSRGAPLEPVRGRVTARCDEFHSTTADATGLRHPNDKLLR